MTEFLLENVIEFISILIAIVTFVIPIYKYIFDRSLQIQDARFKIYHGIIKSLVEPELLKENVIDEETKLIHNVYGKMQDRQLATIFEMRNFPEYFEVTVRILRGLKTKWEKDGVQKALINEILYTLSYIEIYNRGIYTFLRWTRIFAAIASWCVTYEVSRLDY